MIDHNDACQILQSGICTCHTAPLVNSPALLLSPTMRLAMAVAWDAGAQAVLMHGTDYPNPYRQIELPSGYCEGCGLHQSHCDCEAHSEVRTRDCAVCDQMLYQDGAGEWIHAYPNDCTATYGPAAAGSHKYNQRGDYS